MRAEGGEKCEADSRLTARTENVTYSIFIAHIYVVLPALYDPSGPVLLSVSVIKRYTPCFYSLSHNAYVVTLERLSPQLEISMDLKKKQHNRCSIYS